VIAKTHWSGYTPENSGPFTAALFHEPAARQALDTLLALQMQLELATGIPVAIYGPIGQMLPGISPARPRRAEQSIPPIKELLHPQNWPQKSGQLIEMAHGNHLHFFLTPLVLRGLPVAQVVLGPLQLFEPGAQSGHGDGSDALSLFTPISGVPVMPSWKAQAAADLANALVKALCTPADDHAQHIDSPGKHRAWSDQVTALLPLPANEQSEQKGAALQLGSLAHDASLAGRLQGGIQDAQRMQEQPPRLEAANALPSWLPSARIQAASDYSAQSHDEPGAWLQSLIETMPQAVLVATAPDGQIMLANSAARRLWPGLLAGQASGGSSSGPLNSRCSADQYPPEWVGLSVALREGARLFRTEVSVEVAASEPPSLSQMPQTRQAAPRMSRGADTIAPRPRQHPMLVSAFPLRTPRGSISHAVAIFEDLSGLLERERFKDELLLAASHDARNPLTLISSYAQLLERTLAMEIPSGQALERAHGRLAEIQEQVQLLTELSDQLYAATRLQSAQQRPRVESVNLARLIQRAAIDQQMITPGHVIETRVAYDPCLALGDTASLQQILLRLLSNAVRYSRPGKPVSVSLRCTPENNPLWAEVSVRDQGIGIPRASLPHIFERFYRVPDNEQRARAAGLPRPSGEPTNLGLGLYLCKQLIERMGGRIWVDSVEGQGATISFTVPLKR